MKISLEGRTNLGGGFEISSNNCNLNSRNEERAKKWINEAI